MSTRYKGTFALPSARKGVRVRQVAQYFLSLFATGPGAKNKPIQLSPNLTAKGSEKHQTTTELPRESIEDSPPP